MSIKKILIGCIALGLLFTFMRGDNPTNNRTEPAEAMASEVQKGNKKISSIENLPITDSNPAVGKKIEEEKKINIPEWFHYGDNIRYTTEEEKQNIIKFWPTIRSCSEEYGIDPYLITSQIYSESHFWDKVIYGQTVSVAGATGISQFLPSTAKAYGVSESELRDPIKSINLMCRYMSEKLKKFNVDEALAAYHQGETGMRRNGLEPSRYYISNIKSNLTKLKP